MLKILDYISTFTTIFVGDSKALFEQEVDRLIELHFSIEDRKLAVGFLTERYYEDTGKTPNSYQLDRLATHLLYECLEGDSRRDKITLEEYPILTTTQEKRRRQSRGETPVDFNVVSYIGSDGANHYKPTRRPRRPYEHDYVEKQAQKNVKEANKTYKDATTAGKVNVSKLDQARD